MTGELQKVNKIIAKITTFWYCGNVIVSYGNKLARDLVENKNSKEIRQFPAELYRVARKKLNMLHAAKELKDLLIPPGNRLHKLHGDREGSHAISINDQWRITFRWHDSNALDVRVEDYHS